MQQVRVTAVNGRKVQAGGKWLTAIGNNAVSVGAFVWTDGKCVYGHHSDAGGAPTIIANKPEEIPLLIGKYSVSEGNQYGAYNPRKGVNVFRQGEKHDGLINTRNKFALIDNNTEDKLHWEDVSMDADGNIYGIDSGQSNSNGTYGVVTNNPVRLYGNGNCILYWSREIVTTSAKNNVSEKVSCNR